MTGAPVVPRGTKLATVHGTRGAIITDVFSMESARFFSSGSMPAQISFVKTMDNVWLQASAQVAIAVKMMHPKGETTVAIEVRDVCNFSRMPSPLNNPA